MVVTHWHVWGSSGRAGWIPLCTSHSSLGTKCLCQCLTNAGSNYAEPRGGEAPWREGVQQGWFLSWVLPLARPCSRVMARNGRPSRRTRGLLGYLHSFKILKLQGPEEDASAPGSSHWSGEVQGRGKIHFPSFHWRARVPAVGSTAALTTPLKGPAPSMRGGAQREPFLQHLRG